MKIGILTLYYNNRNCGAMLQSYALVKFLRDNGFDAEQICYEINCRQYSKKENERAQDSRNIVKISFFGRVIRSVKYRYKYYVKERFDNFRCDKYVEKHLKERYNNFQLFQNSIPHSLEVYTNETICDASEYDCYIVGSDQVWNFDWFTPVFFLEFVTKSKRKVAYATSAGRSEFDDEELQYLKRTLPTFDAISVREKELVSVYASLNAGISPQFVVDPVFLLEEDDWNQVCCKRLIKEKYVFSFFLGNDDEMKKLAVKYAKQKHLKLAVIPFCLNKLFRQNKLDVIYGDKRIHNAGPREFLSLVKYSECVFTDSFHAMAFSIIFKKQFFVFDRLGFSGMSDRIRTVTKLIEYEDHFCDTTDKRTDGYIMKVENKKKYFDSYKLNDLKKDSKEFLLNALVK